MGAEAKMKLYRRVFTLKRDFKVETLQKTVVLSEATWARWVKPGAS